MQTNSTQFESNFTSQEAGEPEIAVKAKFEIAEGPLWVPEENALYFIDVPACKLYRFCNSENKISHEWQMTDKLGFILPRLAEHSTDTTKSFLGGFKSGIYIIDLNLDDTSEVKLTQLRALESFPSEANPCENRLNDGKIDKDGNLWCGSLNDQFQNTGYFYRIIPDKEVSADKWRIDTVDGPMLITNGPTFSPDGKYVYHNESYMAKATYRYEIMDDCAEMLKSKKELFKIDPEMYFPDGLCTDSEGHLWIAQWEGCRVVRINSQTGKIMHVVNIPSAARISSCCFGGEDLSTLFVTTASGSMTDNKFENGGSLFKIQTNYTGLPFNKFKA